MLPCLSPFPRVCPSSCSLHQWYHPAISSSDALFSFCPPIFPSIRDFSNESSARIRWPKYWSFSISISPSSEYSGLISLQTDSFDLLAVQETFRLVQVNDTFAFYKRELCKKDWFLVSWVTVSFWELVHCRDQKYASRMKKISEKELERKYHFMYLEVWKNCFPTRMTFIEVNYIYLISIFQEIDGLYLYTSWVIKKLIISRCWNWQTYILTFIFILVFTIFIFILYHFLNF